MLSDVKPRASSLDALICLCVFVLVFPTPHMATSRDRSPDDALLHRADRSVCTMSCGRQ